jgi:hypothetical protein
MSTSKATEAIDQDRRRLPSAPQMRGSVKYHR